MRFDAFFVNGYHTCEVIPAPRKREWFSEAAYSCTPMALANEAGWWLTNPRAFAATWDGAGIDISGESPIAASHFGMGVLTMHVGIVFRTEPGWSLLVQGPVNQPKDGIGALQGIIETDTAYETFTMNWRFTRPCEVTFEEGEPFAQVTPVPTGIVDDFEPRTRDLSEDPELQRQHLDWVHGRVVTNAAYGEGSGRRQRNYIGHVGKKVYTPQPFPPP